MRVIRKNKDILAFLNVLKGRLTENEEVRQKVSAILADVRRNGDSAVVKYTKTFDCHDIKELRIKDSEISKYARKVDRTTFDALKLSAERIRLFHEMQKEDSWFVTEPGYQRFSADKFADALGVLEKNGSRCALLGQIVRPLERVGVYIPGGKASYPSTVFMNVIPAQVAGVKEIAICTPTPEGEINPYVMAVVKLLGIKEVYRIGGAQAIGAMAYGTKTIRKVDKIVGPGNIYVTTAKRMVFGEVDVDMIAGPSEILIIADDSADPQFVAADLLSQAEHDELASAILITDSMRLAGAVKKELEKQLSKLKRKEIAKHSIGNYGAILITKDLREATELANYIAPEHLQIMIKTPMDVLPAIKNAASIFVGDWTPEVLGDYSAGPNHTLPTGGTARFSSPLGVYDFVKRSSLLTFTRSGFRKLAPTVEAIAQAEGLEAHANTIRIRMSKTSD